MKSGEEKEDLQPAFDERRLLLEERRLALDNSFARKWLPTLATLMVGVIAAGFSYVQHLNSLELTRRAQIEANIKNEREWGFKIIEMYFNNRELFDIAKHPDSAELNLRVLAAAAPAAVQGVLSAEQSRLPPPAWGGENLSRINSLAAIAGVQDALATVARPGRTANGAFAPSQFTVYLQYASEQKELPLQAQSALIKMGYRVPGIDKVDKAPSRLEVRYYQPGQKAYALELAGQLGKALNLPAGPDSAQLVQSSRKLPGGILEVWLPQTTAPRPSYP